MNKTKHIRKIKKFQFLGHLGLIIAASAFLSGCTLPFVKTQKTALDIKSNHPSTVYINDDSVGSTPFYRDNLKPGQYTVRLQSEENTQLSWSTQVDLKPQLLTSIQKNFANTKDAESHFTLSLKPISKNETSLTIISIPDSTVVKVDDQPIGFSPVKEDQISPGDHQVVLSSPGYRELPILIKIIPGHELIVSAQLAKDKSIADQSVGIPPSPPQSTEETTNSPPKEATPASTLSKLVKITETGTGWLRVRKDPNIGVDNEVFRVDVGKSYPLLDDTESDWYQIEYSKGKKGWISSKYANIAKSTN